jgi:hypothetical protein
MARVKRLPTVRFNSCVKCGPYPAFYSYLFIHDARQQQLNGGEQIEQTWIAMNGIMPAKIAFSIT